MYHLISKSLRSVNMTSVVYFEAINFSHFFLTGTNARTLCAQHQVIAKVMLPLPSPCKISAGTTKENDPMRARIRLPCSR
jgi:hypothetical protein